MNPGDPTRDRRRQAIEYGGRVSRLSTRTRSSSARQVSGLTLTALATTGLLVAGLAACASPVAQPTPAPASTTAPGPSPSPSPTPAPAPAPSPSPSPTPTLVPTSPLTGEPAATARPVLIVKLDNTQYAQPHAGLTKADIVYLEEVEYGITRIAAVFSTSIPRRIGPIRSARITDVDLVAQFGRPAFGYSGAQRKMWPVLAAASIFDVSPNHGASAYRRDYRRYAPYNLFADGRRLLAVARKASLATDIGLVFDEAPPEGGTAATKVSMKWGYSAAAFEYDPEAGSYRVWLNGRRARAEETAAGQSADTVVVQYVKQEPSRFFDKGGGNTPLAHTVGSGDGIVLRDGRAWEVRWHRPSLTAGTTFTLPDGSAMPFKPGQTWVVLRDRTRPVRVTAPRVEPASPSAVPPSSSTSSGQTTR